jgi:hypothetical protein
MDGLKKYSARNALLNLEISEVFAQQSGRAKVVNKSCNQAVLKGNSGISNKLGVLRKWIDFGWLISALGCILLILISCRQTSITSCTVPVLLDHNRMLVDAEIQRKDGSWRQVRLWIDTGNPEFFISESLALDLGIDLSAAKENIEEGRIPPLEVPSPAGVRIAGMAINFSEVKSKVMFGPKWLFNTMHNDANLPSTVLKQYQVIFDYPGLCLTLAEPGTKLPQGVRIPASVHPQTGILQVDVVIAGDTLSLALDNGASYSFVSEEVLARFSQQHPDWPYMNGALGCANIWGWCVCQRCNADRSVWIVLG